MKYKLPPISNPQQQEEEVKQAPLPRRPWAVGGDKVQKPPPVSRPYVKPEPPLPVRLREDIDDSSSDDDEAQDVLGNDRDMDDERIQRSQQRLKSHAKQDWNYLKETLNGGRKWHNEDEDDRQNIDMQEKAGDVIEKEEELVALHMQLIKENAQVLTKEGELISYVQETDDYDIEYYVDRVQQVAERKLKLYNLLREKLNDFKMSLREEEEMHRQTTQAKNGAGFFNNRVAGRPPIQLIIQELFSKIQCIKIL